MAPLATSARTDRPDRGVVKTRKEERERERGEGGGGDGEFHPVIVSTLPDRCKVRKIEIRIRRVRRFAPITTPGIVRPSAGNSLILITRAIMYRDYRVVPHFAKQSAPYLHRAL